MEVAAIVTAVTSVLIAAGSLVYAKQSAEAAHRSAKAAKKSAWLQSEDDWRARTPSFEVEWNDVIEQTGGAKTYGATIRSLGPERYQSIYLQLLDPPAEEVKVVNALIDLGDRVIGQQVDLGSMDVGQCVRFGVQSEFHADSERRRDGTVDLQVIAQIDDGVTFDEWVVPIQLEIPPVPRVI